MSKVFDKLLASRPVNQAAARVLGGGVHYNPQKTIAQRHWTAPPKTILIEQMINEQCFVDLTGCDVGRFKVIGYLGKFKKGSKPLWLVRCSCGDYESRTAASIRNPANSGDRCEICRNLVHLKRQEAWLRNPTAPQSDSLSDF